MSVRVALIGVGIMGADHARIFAEDIPNVQLQVVCDAFEERATEIAKKYGASHVSNNPQETVTRSDVDAVVIASPDQTHAPLSIAAIEAGKHVLCEKPLAPTSEQCLEVLEVEKRLGKQMVQVGFMRRFDPAYTQMKDSLANGAIGKAIMFHCFHRNVEAPANFTGQMAISNSAPHEFDAARFILDEDIAAISVFQPKSVDTTKTGAPVFMVMETQSGQLVNVEINNNAAYGYDVRGELVGERGSVFLQAPVHSLLNANLQAVENYPADWRPRFAEAYRLQNKAWIQSILSGEPSPIASNAWDGYCASLIAEAGVQALNEGRKVTIEMINKPTIYQ